MIELKTSIINGDVPLLLSKAALAQLKMLYDVAANRADFGAVGLKGFDLITTSSGHPAIPIVPARPADGAARLVILDKGASSSEQYMAFAVSAASLSDTRPPKAPTSSTTSEDQSRFHANQGPHYKVFYDKKLSPQARELLSQDRLQEQSFVTWWEQTKLSSDFWLEGETAWYRIHVTPRRALCNPSTWKTQSTLQKDMLLSLIGDLRITEGFCCRSGKPLEVAVDRWRDGKHEPCFPLLWIGRSTFAKIGPSAPRLLPPPSSGHVVGMQAARDQCYDEDPTLKRVQQAGAGCAPDLDGRGAEGRDPGTSHAGRVEAARAPDESSDEFEHAGAEDEGHGDGRRVPGQHHQGQPPATHQGQPPDAGDGAHEDREVQGIRVPGDPLGLRRVGREVKSSAVRYAKWWDNEQATRYTGDTTTIEEDSVVPYPGSESGASSVWGLVSDWGAPRQETDTKAARSSGYSGSRPVVPRANKRTNAMNNDGEMDTELDPSTAAEIQALEARLAALKDKAKAGSKALPK